MNIEQQAREAGYDITVKVQTYGDVAYGWAMEDTTGFCKLIADRATGEISYGRVPSGS